MYSYLQIVKYLYSHNVLRPQVHALSWHCLSSIRNRQRQATNNVIGIIPICGNTLLLWIRYLRNIVGCYDTFFMVMTNRVPSSWCICLDHLSFPLVVGLWSALAAAGAPEWATSGSPTPTPFWYNTSSGKQQTTGQNPVKTVPSRHCS